MRYYRKMLLTFIAIAAAYTVLVDAIFLISYRTSAQTDFSRTVDAVSQQAADYTDYQFRSFQELGILLRSTETLTRYLQEDIDKPDRYSRFQLHRFVSSIYGVTSASKSGLAVTKLLDDYAIMHNTTGELDAMLERFHITQQQLDDVVARFSGQISQPMQLIQSEDGAGNPLYTIITRQWVGRQHPFYFFMHFTEDQLFSLDSGMKSTLAVLYQGDLWAHYGNYSEEEIRSALAADDGRLVRRTMPSAVVGISYVYLTEPAKAIETTTWLIAGAGALALLLSALIMFRITRRMYSPIADMLSVTGVDMTQGDEFAGMQETIESLQTDVQTMSQSLSQYYETVENKFLHDLLTGLVPREEIRERMRQFGLASDGGPYIAVLLRYEETAEPGTDREHSTVYAVRNGLKQALRGNRRLFRAVDMAMMVQGLVFRQMETEALEEYLRGVLLMVEPEYGTEITAYLGQEVDSLEDIYLSYRAAMLMSEQSEYTAVRAKVITAATQQERHKGHEHNVYYPLNMEQALINAVIHGKTSLLHATLHELMQQNASEYEGNFSPLSLMLTATVNRILDGVKRKVEDMFEEDTIVYLEFRSCKDYTQIEQKAVEIFTVLSDYLAAEAKKSSQTIEKQMTEYIHAHYHEDISLFDLAEHVNMSKNYVSTLFRNSTGQTFKDYLSELRHAKACALMRDKPGIRISEVADRVGCSTDTLLRLFMRYSGMTPSDYQQQCRGDVAGE